MLHPEHPVGSEPRGAPGSGDQRAGGALGSLICKHRPSPAAWDDGDWNSFKTNPSKAFQTTPYPSPGDQTAGAADS